MIAALLIALLPVGQPIVPGDRPPMPFRHEAPQRYLSGKEALFLGVRRPKRRR